MKKSLYLGLKGWNKNALRASALFALCICLLQSAHATVLINPNTGGGFESGSSFAANGWTVVNNASGTMNNWYVGTASGSGSNFSYVSNTSGSTHNYDNTTASTVHFYQPVTIPSGETNIQLSFLLKSVGELNADELIVYTGTGAITAGSLPTLTGTYTAVWTQASTTAYVGYTTVYVQLPSALAGTTFNLVFTWTNNANSAGSEPPASVDNVSLTSNPCYISSFPWTEGFESLSTFGSANTSADLPLCWASKDSSGPNWISTNTSERNGIGAHTGTNFLYSTYSANAWVFTPGMQLTGGTTYYFSYYYTATDNPAGCTFTTAVGTQQLTSYMHVLDTIYNVVNTAYKLHVSSYTPAVGGVYYFGINSNSTNPPWYFNLDDISVDVSPPCSSGITSFPWSEGFETIGTLGTSDLPSCWKTQLTSGTDWTSANAAVSNGIGAHTDGHFLYTRPSGDSWVFTPAMNLTANTTYYFSYYYTATSAATGYTITTGVGNSQSSSSMTSLGVITNPVNTSYARAVYSYTPVTGGNYYFGIHSVSTSSSADFNVDDVNVSTTAPCGPISTFTWAEGFEDAAPGTGNTPSCWATTTASGTNWTCANTAINSVSAHTGSHFLYSSGASNAKIYTPGMQLMGGTTYYFNYYYALTTANQAGYTIITEVGTEQDSSSTSNTTTIGIISNPGSKSYREASCAFTPSTTGVYYFDIHSYCPASNSADFIIDDVSLTVAPPCTVSSFPWKEGFEGIGTGTSVVPSCWVTQQVEGGTDWISASGPENGATGANTGTHFMYSTYSNSTWLFTPGMQLTGGNTYYFSYYYALTNSISGFSLVSTVGTNQDSTSSTTLLGTIVNPLNTSYQQALYAYTPTTTGVYYFGIHSIANNPPWYLNIDDVAVQDNSCQAPTPTAPTIVNPTSVDANWTCPGCTGSYIVEYGKASNFFTPGSGATAATNGTVINVPAGNSSTLISGIVQDTIYRYFVRQNCGGGVYSVNYISQTFATAYCTSLYTTGCPNSDAIVGFQLSNLNDNTHTCSSATAATGYGDYTSSSPTINLTAGNTYTWGVTINYSYGHYIKMWIDMNDNGDFEDAGETIVPSTLQTNCGSSPCLTTGSITIPTVTAIPGNHRMRVRIVWSSPTDFGPCDLLNEGEVADYTCNITIPACPVPTSSAPTSINFTSAQANWACTGGCTGSYIVEYGPAATFATPGTGATAGVNGTVINVASGNSSIPLTGLTPGVQYTYYVRENCSGTYSLNSASQTFTTICPLLVNQETGIVPPATTGVNILRVDLPLSGSIVPLTLNSIKFTSKNTNDADIVASGVKLWTGTTTAPSTQIGTAQTFSSGAVTFSGLNFSLSTGTIYYLWLTYDVSATATLLDVMDAKINAGDISFTAAGSPATLPLTLQDPTGNVVINYCQLNLYSSGCTHGDDLTSFDVSNLNNTTSGCSISLGGNGYSDFTTLEPVINFVDGATYTWTATNDYPYGHYLQMWIDYNNDGVFESNEALLSAPYAQPNAGANNVPFGSSFTIPSNGATGNHRFRVRLVWATSTFGACDALYEGDCEDYTCNITAPNCPVPASSAGTNISFTSAQANWTCTGCSGAFIVEYGPTAMFTPGTGATPGTNGTIINVTAGNTSTAITGLTPGTQYTYYVRQDCSASSNGYSINSAGQTFTTIGNITFNQETGIVPPATTGVGILRLDLPLSGNIVTLVLNSLKVTSGNTSDADVAASGVKLWTGSASGPSTQIGTAQTFSSGAATFSGLNLSLSTNTTYYFWLTYDVSPTATLLDVLDAKINAGDIGFIAGGIGTTQPATPQDPTGSVQINYCQQNLYSSGCTHGDDLTSFAVSNLNNTTSGCSISPGGNGYSDFTSLAPVINFVDGATYTWTATNDYPYGHYLQMWIDYNNDGVFESNEALLSAPYAQPNAGANNVPFGSSVTIPTTAASGTHRLRVRLVWATSSFGACDALYEGDAEDYTCNIIAPNCPVPASSAATNISFTSAQANWSCTGGCTGNYIVEYGPTATFTTPGTDNNPGANGAIITVSSATSTPITGLTPGVQYTYYVRQDCSASSNGYSVNSAAQTFTTIGNILFNQETGIVTPGTQRVNILRLDFPLSGNLVSLVLNSIKVTSENTNDADVAASGVKLWTGSTSGPSTQIGTAQTFSSGAVTFSGLNLNLSTNTTYYLWLTYDVSSAATLTDVLDAKINAGDIAITAGGVGTTLPSSLQDPAGNVEIYYCTTYLYTTGCNDNDALISFSISNLNHTGSGCSGNVSNLANSGYGDFTSSEPTINLVQGANYSWTASINYGNGNHWLQMWIDLNDDGIFETSEALLATPFPQPTSTADPATFGSSFTLSPSANTGTHRFRVREVWATSTFDACTQYTYGEVQDYLCNITGDAMLYASSTTTQDNAPVVPGTTNQQIVGLQVVTTGTTSPLSVSSISFNTTGTTLPTDISNARIYYTGNSSTFAATNQFGSTVASPNGSYTENSAQALVNGINYFWLTYDIPDGALLNDYAYGAITSFVLGGINETPSNTSSATRQVQYCAPTPYVDCNSSPDGGIGRVRVNTLDNSSGCSVSGDYTNYTINPTGTQTTTLVAGQNYTIIINRAGTTTVNYMVKVWIDFNQDGIFTNASPELIYNFTSNNAGGFSGSFQVPLTAASGKTRMRVRMAQNVDDACDNPGCVSCTTNYGETEDYEVNICVPPTITVQPAGIAACAGSPFTLSVTATGTTPAYQWQKGAGNIPTATNSSYTVNAAGSGDAGSYTVVINNACGTVTSNPPAVVTVGACNLTWTGATSTDWFDATNWSPQIVPNTCGASVTINVATGNMPVISGANVNIGNLNIASGDSIVLDRQNLSVCGNWTGGSSGNASVSGTGAVILSTNTSQIISGNTRFNILQVSNSSQNGVSLASGASASIAGGLWLAQGNLDVSAGTLTLLSTSSSDNSYIDDFSFGSNPGTITGNIVAQRYVPVKGSNQHYISSPVATPAFSQFSATGPDGAYIIPQANCDEFSSSYASPYGTLFQYNDGHQPQGGCMLGNWEIRSAGSTVNGQGYSTYLPGNTTLSLTSTANTGNMNVSTFNSAYPAVPTLQQSADGGNGAIESGWALVGNPYPSALDLTVDRTTYGYDNQVQVWKTSGPFAGTWQATTITGQSGTVVIPPFQAFMVHVSTVKARGNYTYPFFQSERTRTTNIPFYRSQNQNTLQLALDYNGIQDITTVSFNPSATNSFDAQFDANKQDGSAGNPTLYTFFAGATTWYSINTVPSLTQTAAIPVGLRPNNTGTMTITPQGIESFDPTTYIYLEDKQTGIWTNLRNGSYTFTTTPTDNQQRFVLHFTPPAIVLTQDASCDAPGMINIQQPGTANWNYTVTDVNNVTVASGMLNAGAPVTVSVNSGVYALTLTDNNGYTVVKNVEIGGVQPISSAFTASATTAQIEQNITFNGAADNASVYDWDFGDGATANGAQAIHSYQSEGIYSAKLTVTGTSGCISTTSQTITVTSRYVTGITNLAENKLNIWSYDNTVFVDFSKVDNVNAEVQLYNVLGQMLSDERFGKSTLYSKELTNMEAAYIIVKVTNDDQVTTKKMFIANIDK